MSSQSNCCCSAPSPSTIKKITSNIDFKDILGGWKARWGFGRMKYTVEPGVYALGNPDNNSPVLVSANYKLTFDELRKSLVGLDCWILILDTKGINVWCAAGKGTFGTDELIRRIESSELSKYVSHKKLILPQLGATGVSAHEVTKQTGYDVKFGPVRATDIKEYIDRDFTATDDMRRVNFTLWDRLVLTPMELVPAVKKALPILGVILVANQFIRKPFDGYVLKNLSGSIFSGAVLTPALLPAIPVKSFSLKGWIVGFLITLGIVSVCDKDKKSSGLLSIGSLLLYPAISSYIALNFTGSSTYTSSSGVNKEMKKALPFIVGSAIFGAIITIGVHLFLKEKNK
jgi:hypothetical protein